MVTSLKQQIQQRVVLAPYTSWQIGGPADFFVRPRTIEEVRESLLWAKEHGVAVTVLGGGSNVLIPDEGIRGLVIAMQGLRGVEEAKLPVPMREIAALPDDSRDYYRLTVLAGTPKAEVMKYFLRQQLSPALFLAGLPGDVGGGVVMNAGVAEARHPREFGEIVEWIEVLHSKTGELVRLAHHDLRWSYRRSQGWQPGVIVRAGLKWPREPLAGLQRQVRDANRLRQSKQPLQEPSCGSTFKNPEGTSAGRVIDQCGLKGFQIGGAQVSPKHANFIVNVGGASAEDIRAVIEHVKATVRAQTGIELETEVVFL